MKVVTIKGISFDRYAPAKKDSEAPRLVFAHGSGSNKAHPSMVLLAERFAKAGIDVFLFDFPYAERGKRAPDRAPILEARFAEAVRAVSSRKGGPISIGGRSMGGRMATRLVAASPEIAALVKSLVLVSYPLHPPGAERDASRTAHFPDISIPCLFVQGTRDAFGGPDDLRPYLELLSGKANICAVEDADHALSRPKKSGGDASAEVAGAVIAFLKS